MGWWVVNWSSNGLDQVSCLAPWNCERSDGRSWMCWLLGRWSGLVRSSPAHPLGREHSWVFIIATNIIPSGLRPAPFHLLRWLTYSGRDKETDYFFFGVEYVEQLAARALTSSPVIHKVCCEKTHLENVWVPNPTLIPPRPLPEQEEELEDWEHDISALFEWVGMAGLHAQRCAYICLLDSDSSTLEADLNRPIGLRPMTALTPMSLFMSLQQQV